MPRSRLAEHALDRERRRIDDAPTDSSRGSSCQTCAAGTSTWTATIPSSSRGSTLGERLPGTSAEISLERIDGRIHHQVASLARIDDALQHACELVRAG